jgi:hypothetical protein
MRAQRDKISQPYQAGRIRTRRTGHGHNPIITGEFPFEAKPLSDPANCRVEKEERLGGFLEQVRPVITTPDVRQFVQADAAFLSDTEQRKQ